MSFITKETASQYAERSATFFGWFAFGYFFLVVTVFTAKWVTEYVGNSSARVAAVHHHSCDLCTPIARNQKGTQEDTTDNRDGD